MAEVTLTAETGRTIGTRSSGRLRAEGKIPGVLYGHGADPVPVAVGAREFRHALSGEAGLNTLLSLEVDGTTHLALPRELQRHPVRNTVSHIDFQIVRRDEVIASEVPLTLVGEAEQVADADGVVEQVLFSLTVHSTPGDIPTAIEVPIDQMEIGTTITVADLRLPSGVTTETDPEEAVATATISAVTAEVEAEEEAAAEEAAAAEAGAEGGAAGESPPAEGGGA